MALSYYSNSEAFQHLNSDLTNFTSTQPELLPSELVGCNNDNFTFQDSYNIDDFFYFDESYNSSFLNFSTSDQNLGNISTEPFQLEQEFDPFHDSKRQKINSNYEELYFDQFKFNEFVPNASLTLQDYSSAELIVPQLPVFPTSPPVYSIGSCDRSTKQDPKNRGNLSTQSIAARQRRRKITEKTRELGKLIPGGEKMNTAEMFQAAYKYIKFLQAQVGILEFMDSYDHEEIDRGNFQSEESLQNLRESPVVQEKLYSEEKCLVPKKLVQELRSDDQMFKSKPQALKEIRQLIPTTTGE